MKEKRDKLTFVALQVATKLIILILIAIIRAVKYFSAFVTFTHMLGCIIFFYRLPYNLSDYSRYSYIYPHFTCNKVETQKGKFVYSMSYN